MVAHSWYVYGEFVLDKMLNVARCEDVDVYWSGSTPPSSDEVRQKLSVPHAMGFNATNEPPARTTNLDNLVLVPSGELFDLVTEDTASPLAPPMPIELLTFELTARDTLRINRIIKSYPEVEVDELLSARIAANLAHLEQLRDVSEELELLFMKYQPYTRWRTGS